jgi:hypothetical protein
MIRDLLRDIVGDRWVELIDLDSGEQVNASFVSARHKRRESDVIWKFQRKDGKEPVYVYILMEFQARPDPSMPVRLMEYVIHFYQSLKASQPGMGWRNLPLVIPMVVYNGVEPWNVPLDLGSLIGDLDPATEMYRPQLRYRLVDESSYSREELAALDSPVADLFWLERSREWPDVITSVGRLKRSIPPAEGDLRRAFETWLQEVVRPRLGLPEAGTGETLTLEEFETMLAESIDRWNRELREEGVQEGLKKGLAQGLQTSARILLSLLRLKFGPLAPETEERVRAADAERLVEWSECVLGAERLEDVFGD